MLTPALLRQICPTMTEQKAQAVATGLWPAMLAGNIDTPARMAAFIAQMAHETCAFKYDQEIWGPTPAQAGYEGRADLGNGVKGDGYRFRGRGYIQITGRANYARYGKAIGVDLIANPDLASRPDIAARIAVAYWLSNGLNILADQGNFREITKRINGGYNGLADRVRYYERAKAAIAAQGPQRRRVFLHNGKGYELWGGKAGDIYGGLPLGEALFTQLDLLYPNPIKTTYNGVKFERAADGALLFNKF